MVVGCTEQVAVPQIEWVAMEEQWPPIGVEVLACGVGKEFGGIHTNQLDKGSDIGPGYDPELYYWAGGEDFDEVTHWAPMPAMPPANKEAPTVSLAPETEYLLSGQGDHQEWVKLKAFCATPPVAGRPDIVKVPRELAELIAYALHGSGWFILNRKLRALLAAAPPATEQAPRELFTCIGKGGRYELLGESSGAGGCRREGRVIYRCLDTGQLYHRTDDDFAARMAPLTEDGEA